MLSSPVLSICHSTVFCILWYILYFMLGCSLENRLLHIAMNRLDRGKVCLKLLGA